MNLDELNLDELNLFWNFRKDDVLKGRAHIIMNVVNGVERKLYVAYCGCKSIICPENSLKLGGYREAENDGELCSACYASYRITS